MDDESVEAAESRVLGDQKPRYSDTSLGGDEMDAPPCTQGKGEAHSGRSKSTPSTLSEDLEDHVNSEGEASQRSGRARGTARKRVAGKSTGSESRETSEDRQDGKRKPRKSARLG